MSAPRPRAPLVRDLLQVARPVPPRRQCSEVGSHRQLGAQDLPSPPQVASQVRRASRGRPPRKPSEEVVSDTLGPVHDRRSRFCVEVEVQRHRVEALPVPDCFRRAAADVRGRNRSTSATSASASRKSWRRAENPFVPRGRDGWCDDRDSGSLLHDVETISVPGVVRTIQGPAMSLRERLEWGHGDAPRCRLCDAPLLVTFVDLGSTPLANSYVDPAFADQPDPDVIRCTPSASPASWCSSSRRAAAEIFGDYAVLLVLLDCVARPRPTITRDSDGGTRLDADSLVVEIASNDGYLLQYFVEPASPCSAIDPAANVAAVARSAASRRSSSSSVRSSPNAWSPTAARPTCSCQQRARARARYQRLRGRDRAPAEARRRRSRSSSRTC